MVCEYCNREITEEEKPNHPCYLVEKAMTTKIRSVAMYIERHPGYALIVPEGDGYNSILSFMSDMARFIPPKRIFKFFLPQILIVALIGALLGAGAILLAGI